MPNLDNLFRLLQNRGSSKDLSNQTGISTGNISDWKSGRSKPGLEALIKIADYFDCSIDYILGRTDIRSMSTNSSDIISIPIFLQKAAAGLGKETNNLCGIKPEYEMRWFIKEKVPKAAEYGIIIEGDSMEPRFHDGQVVFVKLANDCPESGYGIFVITEGIETKVYFKQKKILSNNTYVLHSLNDKKYKDISDFENKICKCIAVVVF